MVLSILKTNVPLVRQNLGYWRNKTIFFSHHDNIWQIVHQSFPYQNLCFMQLLVHEESIYCGKFLQLCTGRTKLPLRLNATPSISHGQYYFTHGQLLYPFQGYYGHCVASYNAVCAIVKPKWLPELILGIHSDYSLTAWPKSELRCLSCLG